MNKHSFSTWFSLSLIFLGLAQLAHAHRLISGNENKIDLIPGGIRVISPPGYNSISIIELPGHPASIRAIP